MSNPMLVDITGEYADESKVPEKKKKFSFTHAVAKFSDGTELAFPPECVLYPDHHFDMGGEIVQYRLRVTHPLGEDGKPIGPHFWVPKGCSMEYVKSAIKRAELRV